MLKSVIALGRAEKAQREKEEREKEPQNKATNLDMPSNEKKNQQVNKDGSPTTPSLGAEQVNFQSL